MSFLDNARGKLFAKQDSVEATIARSRAMDQLMEHVDMSNYGKFDYQLCHRAIEKMMSEDKEFDAMLNAAASIPPASDEMFVAPDGNDYLTYGHVEKREPSLKKLAAKYGMSLQQEILDMAKPWEKRPNLDDVITEPSSQQIENVSGPAKRTGLDDIIDGYREVAPKATSAESDDNRGIERETPADDSWRTQSLDDLIAGNGGSSHDDEGLGF